VESYDGVAPGGREDTDWALALAAIPPNNAAPRTIDRTRRTMRDPDLAKNVDLSYFGGPGISIRHIVAVQQLIPPDPLKATDVMKNRTARGRT
jgi:hypothetical protein